MTELKTLKDIEKLYVLFKGASHPFADELRAEAIKEVKLIQSGEGLEIPAKFNKGENPVETYIKWKNNLTEKDLQEKKDE